jgi:hypothetical protein
MATTGPTQPDELGLAEMSIETPGQTTKEPETLFGPNIGVVPSGPAWTESGIKHPPPGDELTLDILKSWITKSKEVRSSQTCYLSLFSPSLPRQHSLPRLCRP